MKEFIRYSDERLGVLRSFLVKPDLPPAELPPEPLPEDEVDLLTRILDSVSFPDHPHFSAMDPSDPFDVDEGVVWLSKDILKIYAKPPFNVRAARLELLLVLSRAVSGITSNPADRLTFEEEDGSDPAWFELLSNRIANDDFESAILDLPHRISSDRELCNAFCFLEMLIGDLEVEGNGVLSVFLPLVDYEQAFDQRHWYPHAHTENPWELNFWTEALDRRNVLRRGLIPWDEVANPFGMMTVVRNLPAIFDSREIGFRITFVDSILWQMFGYGRIKEEHGYTTEALRPFYDTLRPDVPVDPNEFSVEQWQICRAWIRVALLLVGYKYAGREAVPADDRNLVRQHVRRRLGSLASRIRQAGTESDIDWDEWEIRTLVAAIHVFDDTAFNLKHLSLAIWGATFPLVLPDLRYWRERNFSNDPFPKAAIIPDRISWVLRSLKDHQAEDLTLNHLRTEYADFCLSRLGSRSKEPARDEQGFVLESELKEPSPGWRLAFIEAASVLRVNPKGRGHRVLHWVSRNDPSEDVRNAARAAENVMRHGSPLPPGASPRRPLFAAFWFLRRAHLRALGISIDTDGANRTRMKEVTYSREN